MTALDVGTQMVAMDVVDTAHMAREWHVDVVDAAQMVVDAARMADLDMVNVVRMADLDAAPRTALIGKKSSKSG